MYQYCASLVIEVIQESRPFLYCRARLLDERVPQGMMARYQKLVSLMKPFKQANARDSIKLAPRSPVALLTR